MLINCLYIYFFLIYLEHFDFPTSSFHAVSVPALRSIWLQNPPAAPMLPREHCWGSMLAAGCLSWGCVPGGPQGPWQHSEELHVASGTPNTLLAGEGVQAAISGTMWTWAAPHHHPGVTRAYLHGKLLYNSWVHLSWKRPSRSSLVESHRADKQEASTFLLVWARF